MAIAHHALSLIAPHMKGMDVLSLGYPDLLLTDAETEEIFGLRAKSHTNRNTRHSRPDPLPETVDILGRFCKSFECVDIEKFSGVEKIADLNHPQDLGQFDVVLDPGTTEHCFNIGQALMNAANAVRPGGRILHLSPVTMVNHGFYNLCPTLFHDFYKQNGWKIEHMEIRASVGEGKEASDMINGKATERFKAMSETGICVLVQRMTDKWLSFPTQTKYLNMVNR